MGIRTRDVLAVLDAAYAVIDDDRSWLEGIAGACSSMFDRGLGVTAYLVELGGPQQVSAWNFTTNHYVDAEQRWRTLLATAGPEFLRSVHMAGTFATTDNTQVIDRPGIRGAIDTLDRYEAGGAAGVMGIDAEGRGVSLASWAPMGRSAAPRAGEAAFWDRVAPHLAAAARLRRRLAGVASPDAVLDVGGRVVHAEPSAAASSTRAALRDAVVALDRLHARPDRTDTDEALQLWRCMFEKRWTLVEQFERDGRRFVVAHPNVPRGRAALEALSPRERAAACAAAMGHPNKVIAYELDLAESTVANLLLRASRKLGVSSRIQLVGVVRAATTRDDLGGD